MLRHKIDEIDEIWSCNGLKYDIYKIYNTFGLINIDGDQNIRQKKTPLRTRSFLSSLVHLKEFGPCDICIIFCNPMIKPMEREIVSMKLKKHEPKERDKKKKQERWQFF
jgi:hypothetical protein